MELMRARHCCLVAPFTTDGVLPATPTWEGLGSQRVRRQRMGKDAQLEHLWSVGIVDGCGISMMVECRFGSLRFLVDIHPPVGCRGCHCLPIYLMFGNLWQTHIFLFSSTLLGRNI